MITFTCLSKYPILFSYKVSYFIQLLGLINDILACANKQ